MLRNMMQAENIYIKSRNLLLKFPVNVISS